MPEENKIAEEECRKPLPMFARYGGAWNEYNTRMTIRYGLTQIWLTALTVLIGAVYASYEHAKNSGGTDYILTTIAAFAIPSVNLIHATLLWMHDVVLGKLHVYMIRCEYRYNNEITNSSGPMPSFHYDEKQGFLNARILQSFVFGVIAVAGAGAAYNLISGAISPFLRVVYCAIAFAAAVSYPSAILLRKRVLDLCLRDLKQTTTDKELKLGQRDVLKEMESLRADISKQITELRSLIVQNGDPVSVNQMGNAEGQKEKSDEPSV